MHTYAHAWYGIQIFDNEYLYHRTFDMGFGIKYAVYILDIHNKIMQKSIMRNRHD